MGSGYGRGEQYGIARLKYMLAVGCAAGTAELPHIADVLIDVDEEIKRPMSRLTNFKDPMGTANLSVAFLFVRPRIYSGAARVYVCIRKRIFAAE